MPAWQAVLNDPSAWIRPDVDNAEFVLFLGATPGHSGKPMQAIGRKTVGAAADGKLKFAVVDPLMLGGAHGSVGDRSEWIPIKPATDGALVMGMLRCMFEQNRIAGDFLECPNLPAAKQKGYGSWTNAAYLVISDPAHPNNRKFLRPEDLGWPVPQPEPPKAGAAPAPAPEWFLVIDARTGQPARHDQSEAGQLFYEGEVTDASGKAIRVRTALSILKESATRLSMDEYAQACGISRAKIEELAREFTAHGHKVGLEQLGSSTTANSYFATLGATMLAVLTGSVNKKGGMLSLPPTHKFVAPGPRYDLTKYPGQFKATGVRIGRDGMPYEKTSEYRAKVARGENPYPSKLPWYALPNPSDNQVLYSLVNGYPYKAKILMIWFANPLMTTPGGANDRVAAEFKKPENIPLILAFDAFMGESSAMADYLIPDVTQYETWGSAGGLGFVPTKISTLRWPVVEPMTAKLPDGRHANFEHFLIDVAVRLGLPGFGENAIPGADGKLFPLQSAEDFWLKGVANIAFDDTPVPDLSAEEAALQGLESINGPWKGALKPDEWPKVNYVLARGGRFENAAQGFTGTDHKYALVKKPLTIYHEAAALARNSLTGEFFPGTAAWMPETLADGTPLDKAFPAEAWPFRVASHKDKFRGVSMLANAPVLRDLSPTNYVEMNPADAAGLGLKDGDKVKVISATGAEATGTLQVRPGVGLGVLGIAFGYGHWQYGARGYQVGEKSVAAEADRGAGIAVNSLSLLDPTYKTPYGLSDPAIGTGSRNGGRFKVVRA